MKSTIFLNEMDAEAIRLIYVKIDQQRLKNGKYLTETSYNISNPYKLPEDMTLKDACYIASYVSNQLENDGLIEHKTEECVTKVASQLEKYPHGKKLIGLGGSCTTAAGIAIGRTVHGEDAEGLKVTLEEARCQLSRLSRLPLEERKKVAGLPPERAVHMPHGLSILVSAMELCGYEEMTVSGKNNLDGFLLTTK